jgi:hypothetical protein
MGNEIKSAMNRPNKKGSTPNAGARLNNHPPQRSKVAFDDDIHRCITIKCVVRFGDAFVNPLNSKPSRF